MKKDWIPIYAKRGYFYLHKENGLFNREQLEVQGPVSFLFSCTPEMLGKQAELSLPLPGMFQAIQMYFSLIEERSENERRLLILDRLPEVVAVYQSAFSWLIDGGFAGQIIIKEVFCENDLLPVFHSIIRQMYHELSLRFPMVILTVDG